MAAITIVTIDGPAGSGKGTLARKLADHFGWLHFDVGLLYRSVGKAVLDAGGDFENYEQMVALAQELDLHAIMTADTSTLRTEEVALAASQVTGEQVYEIVLQRCQNFFQNPPDGVTGIVIDARYGGTLLAPEAQVKLIVTARLETRAMRRMHELQNLSITCDFPTIHTAMKKRDHGDVAREFGALKRAKEAVTINTTSLDSEQVYQKALEIIMEKSGYSDNLKIPALLTHRSLLLEQTL
jgi:cytidylate kinase